MSDPIADAIGRYVTAGELAGATALVWRGGAVVQSAAVGWRNREAGAPMTRDTIFRIASLTKPVTSVAALMLMQEGAFALDDPITVIAPEFAAMRVLRAPAGPLDDTEPAHRAITFEDLLTHRSGLTYGAFHGGPLAAAQAYALGGDIDSIVAPDDWIAGLGSLPLVDQPGAGFHYGYSSELLGQLIARLEGASLGEVLQRRIFGPLGMVDTSFTVAPENRHRRATMYGFDDAGALTPLTACPDGAFLAERPDDMAYVSGGAGLWSTADDYLAFARTFLGETSLLKPETLALMTANRLTDGQRARAENFGMPLFTAHGFGLGVAVVMDPERAQVARCKGGIGTVGWPGAYGGWWQADPADGSVMVLLAHNRFNLDQLSRGIGLGVYAAITEVHALASA